MPDRQWVCTLEGAVEKSSGLHSVVVQACDMLEAMDKAFNHRILLLDDRGGFGIVLREDTSAGECHEYDVVVTDGDMLYPESNEPPFEVWCSLSLPEGI